MTNIELQKSSKNEIVALLQQYQTLIGDLTKESLSEISEKLELYEKIKISEEKLRVAFESSPDSININRLSDGLFLDVNEGFTNITGYSYDDVIGKTSFEIDIWYDYNDRQTLIEGLQKSGKVDNQKSTFKMKDGNLKYGLMSAQIITIKDEPCIISVTRDIDKIVKMEQELLKKQELINHIQRMEIIGRTAGSIGHDFKNFLQVILNSAEFIKLNMGDLDENVDIIIEYSKKASSMASDLLSLSQTKLTSSPNKAYININQTIRELLKSLKTISKTVDIELQLDEDLRKIYISQLKFEQILVNLIMNSLDAIGVMNNGCITIRTQNKNDCTCIEVTDDGSGIPIDIINRIFDPYFTTKSDRGTGLGLYTVKNLIIECGGTINVENIQPNGAKFLIEFKS